MDRQIDRKAGWQAGRQTTYVNLLDVLLYYRLETYFSCTLTVGNLAQALNYKLEMCSVSTNGERASPAIAYSSVYVPNGFI